MEDINLPVTALHIASYYGLEEIFHELIKDPSVDVNAQTENGVSSLILTTIANHEHIVYQLLQTKTVDVNLRTRCDRDTALMLAAFLVM
jgi:ankyrin repeat protein